MTTDTVLEALLKTRDQLHDTERRLKEMAAQLKTAETARVRLYNEVQHLLRERSSLVVFNPDQTLRLTLAMPSRITTRQDAEMLLFQLAAEEIHKALMWRDHKQEAPRP